MSGDNSQTSISQTPMARPHNWQQHSRVNQSHVNQSRVQHEVKPNNHYRPDGQASVGDHNDAQQTPLIVDGVSSLAIEAAIAIVINGIHYAVLMASPSQLEYLALGFLFSEGLIEHRHELLDWEVTVLNTDAQSSDVQSSDAQSSDTQHQAVTEKLADQLQDYDAYLVELVLNQRCYQRIQAQKRQLAGRTGCGMCGMTGLTQALPDLSRYQQTPATLPSLDTLLAIRAQMSEAQQAHQLTGALHAAATVYHGQLQLFEDVGRHNALDKLIGWQLRHKAELNGVVMTSRLSIELVQKAIRGRTPWLVGMSAPTSTAVNVATRYGLGLAGFLRDNRVTFYTPIPHTT